MSMRQSVDSNPVAIRYWFHRADEFRQISPQCCGIAPGTSRNKCPFRVDHKFRVWRISQSMFQVVLKRITNPGNLTAELCFRTCHMLQSLCQRKRGHVTFVTWVRECFVDVEKTYALGSIVFINRLQTGDIPEKRRSRQAPKHQNRVLST